MGDRKLTDRLSIREQIWNRAREEPGENLDPTPVEVPSDAGFPETIQEMVDRMVTQRLDEFQAAKKYDESPEFIEKALNVDGIEADGVEDVITQHTVVEMDDDGLGPTVDELMDAAAKRFDVPEDVQKQWEAEDNPNPPMSLPPVDKQESNEASD